MGLFILPGEPEYRVPESDHLHGLLDLLLLLIHDDKEHGCDELGEGDDQVQRDDGTEDQLTA